MQETHLHLKRNLTTSATNLIVCNPCLQNITLNVNHADKYVHQPLLTAMIELKFLEEMRIEGFYNITVAEAIVRHCPDSLAMLTVKSKNPRIYNADSDGSDTDRDVESSDDADTNFELDAGDGTDIEADFAADVEPIAVFVFAAGAGTLRVNVIKPVSDLALPARRPLSNLKRLTVEMDDRGQPEESVHYPLLRY